MTSNFIESSGRQWRCSQHRSKQWVVVFCHLALGVCCLPSGTACAQSRYASSDNLSGYVHWIELYDADNNRIDPTAEFPRPYSTEKTCGRCHDYASISHGWHFNAIDERVLESAAGDTAAGDTQTELRSPGPGRPGQPWIWSDPRTGTHLPLSYRGGRGTFHPDELGLTRWQVAAKFGGFLPGGGPGSAEALAKQVSDAGEASVDRSQITGPLPIDCMICHHNTGSGYSPFVWTEQIEDENFAYAPTAALGIATITGSMRQLKEGFDPSDPESASKLPKVQYEPARFRSDGKVFMDLIRKPKSDACNYCHSNIQSDSLVGDRWLHDEDIHMRAGFECADCHRNSIDHATVRGFEGEQHPAGSLVASLSCQGCHVGSGVDNVPSSDLANLDNDATLAALRPDAAGRMGAPLPGHRGLPPLHFEKMSCTACHSGPAPQANASRQLNSIVHRLGEHVKRTGDEFPGIVAALALKTGVGHSNASVAVGSDAGPSASKSTAAQELGEEDFAAGNLAAENAAAQYMGSENMGSETREPKYTPHRLMWPSYWGTLSGWVLKALNPEEANSLVRKSLKVRREFTEELAEVKLSLGERTELLGEDRARLKPEDWTEEETAKIAEAEGKARRQQVGERMAAALSAIEEAYPGTQAIFISGGAGFVRDGDDKITAVDSAFMAEYVRPVTWPLAHNVRPARQSLGSGGCADCHSEGALFFNTSLQPVGLLPDQITKPIEAHEFQDVDMQRLGFWNQMFAGRSLFKVLGIVALGITCLMVLASFAWNLGNRTVRLRESSSTNELS